MGFGAIDWIRAVEAEAVEITDEEESKCWRQGSTSLMLISEGPSDARGLDWIAGETLKDVEHVGYMYTMCLLMAAVS